MKLFLKNLVCQLGFGSWLIEFCEECGNEVEVYWHAPDSLWHLITGKDEGVLCVRCFDDTCRELGFHLQWVPTVNKMRSPSGEWVEPE